MKPIPKKIIVENIKQLFILPGLFIGFSFLFFGQYLLPLDGNKLFRLPGDSPKATAKLIEKWEDKYGVERYFEKFYYEERYVNPVHFRQFPNKAGVSLYGYVYEFYSPAGERLSGVAYSGRSLDIGKEIEVVYNADEPRIHRAPAMQDHNLTIDKLLYGALLLIPGLYLLIKGVKTFKRRMRLFKNRSFAWVQFKEKILTEDKKDDQPVFQLIFEFVDPYIPSKTITLVTPSPDFYLKKKKHLIVYDKADHTFCEFMARMYDRNRKFLMAEYEKEVVGN